METRILPDPGELLPLMAGEQADGAVFRQLAHQLDGSGAELARQLSRQARQQEQRLRGIYTLMTGQPPQAGAAEPEAEAPGVALCRCYGRQLRRLSVYKARQDDPEYGPVFIQLAADGEARCAVLAQLLGRL